MKTIITVSTWFTPDTNPAQFSLPDY